MHDCISSNPLCFFDFRGLFLHFLLEYPPNFSPKFFGYTPKLFGYPFIFKIKASRHADKYHQHVSGDKQD